MAIKIRNKMKYFFCEEKIVEIKIEKCTKMNAILKNEAIFDKSFPY